MKVVILAAGLGQRLKDILEGKPKPLFEIKGENLLKYSLMALSKNGIKEVNIAIGNNADMIKASVGDFFEGIKLNYFENKLYDKTGSMHSLFCALKEPEDCLIIDGDSLYDPRMIFEILKCEKENAVILAKVSGSGDEFYATIDEDGRVNHFSKEKPLSGKIYEFPGISKLSKDFVEKMFKFHIKNIQENIFGEYTEDCIYRVGKHIPLYGLVLEHLAWTEIDRKEDIPRAEKVLDEIMNFNG